MNHLDLELTGPHHRPKLFTLILTHLVSFVEQFFFWRRAEQVRQALAFWFLFVVNGKCRVCTCGNTYCTNENNF